MNLKNQVAVMQSPGIFTRVLIMGIILASFVVFVFALVADEQDDSSDDRRLGYVLDNFQDEDDDEDEYDPEKHLLGDGYFYNRPSIDRE